MAFTRQAETKENEDDVTDEEQTLTEPECMHHWLIESPNGPTSEGVCKLCGQRSEFRNSVQGSGWDRESPQSKRMRQARK